jgi:elongation factor P--beta-lysine ligase
MTTATSNAVHKLQIAVEQYRVEKNSINLLWVAHDPLFHCKLVILATMPLVFKIGSAFYNGDTLLGLRVGFVVTGWLSYINQ